MVLNANGGYTQTRGSSDIYGTLNTTTYQHIGGTTTVESGGLISTTKFNETAALVQGLEPGDHILAPSDVYYGLRQVIGVVFGKWPIETSYVDMTDLAALRAAMPYGTGSAKLNWTIPSPRWSA